MLAASFPPPLFGCFQAMIEQSLDLSAEEKDTAAQQHNIQGTQIVAQQHLRMSGGADAVSQWRSLRALAAEGHVNSLACHLPTQPSAHTSSLFL